MSAWKRTMLLTLGAALLAAGGRAQEPPAMNSQPRPEAAEPRDGENGKTEGPEEDPEVGRQEGAGERLGVDERIEVKARGDSMVGIAESAGEGSTGAADLAQRPILRPGEIVETVPGVIATQHSGGGKANQYFVRGFNLDHGTDFRLTAGGVPVNMPTHGHGQGYADFNFVIPELIERVRFRKGPYFAQTGDFSAAGSLDVDLVRSLPQGIVELTGGSYGYERLLVADGFSLAGGELVAALDFTRNDGPWTRPEDYERTSGLLRFSRGDAGRGFTFTAMGHDGSWLATDQIPRRAVEQGRIRRYDLIDPGPRGETRRHSLAFEMHRGGDRSLDTFSAYLLAYDFRLFSNFTYFLDDPDGGDQFEQVDDRLTGGFEVARHWLTSWRGRPVELDAGLQVRYDDIDNGLYRTRDLARVSTTREDAVRQLTGGPYAAATVRWNEWLRTTAGLRIDGYRAEVDSSLPVNSGTSGDLLASPKLSAVFGPWRSTELYLNLGSGFHSNDARGTTIRVDPVSGEPVGRVPPLVRARGADVGVRSTLLPGLQTTFTVFLLELDSELVFVGDAGATEAGRPSRRTGIEWTNHYRLNDEVMLDLDLALSRARFTDDDPAGRRIPGALERVVAAGISVPDLAGWFGSLRLRHFSGYPLIEDDSVRAGATALVNAELGRRFAGGLRISLSGFNLFDRGDSDIEYFYASRLPGEPAEGVEDVHFHPVERPSVRLSVGWQF